MANGNKSNNQHENRQWTRKRHYFSTNTTKDELSLKCVLESRWRSQNKTDSLQLSCRSCCYCFPPHLQAAAAAYSTDISASLVFTHQPLRAAQQTLSFSLAQKSTWRAFSFRLSKLWPFSSCLSKYNYQSLFSILLLHCPFPMKPFITIAYPQPKMLNRSSESPSLSHHVGSLCTSSGEELA